MKRYLNEITAWEWIASQYACYAETGRDTYATYTGLCHAVLEAKLSRRIRPPVWERMMERLKNFGGRRTVHRYWWPRNRDYAETRCIVAQLLAEQAKEDAEARRMGMGYSVKDLTSFAA